MTGVFVNGMFNDFGILPALVFYAMAFLVDFKTTIHVKDYQRQETNPLFHIFSKYFGSKNIAFAMIFLIMIVICIASYYIIAENDTVLIYILGICHLCAATNNYYISKRYKQKQQQRLLQQKQKQQQGDSILE